MCRPSLFITLRLSQYCQLQARFQGIRVFSEAVYDVGLQRRDITVIEMALEKCWILVKVSEKTVTTNLCLPLQMCCTPDKSMLSQNKFGSSAHGRLLASLEEGRKNGERASEMYGQMSFMLREIIQDGNKYHLTKM